MQLILVSFDDLITLITLTKSISSALLVSLVSATFVSVSSQRLAVDQGLATHSLQAECNPPSKIVWPAAPQ